MDQNYPSWLRTGLPLRSSLVSDVPQYSPQPVPTAPQTATQQDMPALGSMGLLDFRQDPRFGQVSIADWLNQRLQFMGSRDLNASDHM
jgi:3-mercaptopyruvate sulfurtransferase SseA